VKLKLNRKFILLIGIVLLFLEASAVQGIDPVIYQEGIKRFSGARDVFRGTVYDPSAGQAVKDEAIARMQGAFLQVTVILQRNDKFSATFYTSDPKMVRKTITDRERVTVNGNQYLVIAQKDGVRVVDSKTNYDYVVKLKGR
jgi:hypothetical protein